MQIEGDMLEEMAHKRLNEPIAALISNGCQPVCPPNIQSCNAKWKSQLVLKTCSYNKQTHMYDYQIC